MPSFYLLSSSFSVGCLKFPNRLRLGLLIENKAFLSLNILVVVGYLELEVGGLFLMIGRGFELYF